MAAAKLVRFVRTRREASVLLMLALVFVGLTFASEYFFTARNLGNFARQISVVGIVALGQALVIIGCWASSAWWARAAPSCSS